MIVLRVHTCVPAAALLTSSAGGGPDWAPRNPMRAREHRVEDQRHDLDLGLADRRGRHRDAGVERAGSRFDDAVSSGQGLGASPSSRRTAPAPDARTNVRVRLAFVSVSNSPVRPMRMLSVIEAGSRIADTLATIEIEMRKPSGAGVTTVEPSTASVPPAPEMPISFSQPNTLVVVMIAWGPVTSREKSITSGLAGFDCSSRQWDTFSGGEEGEWSEIAGSTSPHSHR